MLIPEAGPCCAAHVCQGGNCKTISYSRGEEKTTQTIQALQQVTIVKETFMAFNSPVWPVQKQETWRMTLDYRELSKITPDTCIYVPDMVTLVDKNQQKCINLEGSDRSC